MSKRKPTNPPPTTYAKAIAAGCAAAAGALATAADGGVTTTEVVLVVLTAVGTAAAAYATPNTDPAGVAQDQSVQPPEDDTTPAPLGELPTPHPPTRKVPRPRS